MEPESKNIKLVNKSYVVISYDEINGIEYIGIEGIRNNLVDAKKLACKLAYNFIPENPLEDYVVVRSKDKRFDISFYNKNIITYCATPISKLNGKAIQELVDKQFLSIYDEKLYLRCLNFSDKFQRFNKDSINLELEGTYYIVIRHKEDEEEEERDKELENDKMEDESDTEDDSDSEDSENKSKNADVDERDKSDETIEPK